MIKKILLALSLAFLINFTAWACHTPKRSAILEKQYPDWDFAKMMHKAHSQPYMGYKFQGTTACVDGKADLYECSNVDLIGHLDLTEIGGGQGSDSWGWKHEPTGRYFALVGRSNGTSFVEITDPSAPVYLGNLPSTNGTSSTWRDIKTFNDHAFIVADNIPHNMQVFDLSELLNVENAPVTFSPNKLYDSASFLSAHNIVINEATGMAYLVGGNTCNGGLHMVDINQPLNPTFRGCAGADGYTHDAQCLIYNGPDTEHHDKELCFASNEDTVTVIDVTNKSAPVILSRTGYSGRQYTHQGWLTADSKYFVIDDELDELSRGNGAPAPTRTYVMDMTDLDNPVMKGFHEAGEAGIDHNQYIVNGHTYQANYNRGLRILKLGDLSQAEMTEVAYFDTYPDTQFPSNFGGAWNVYPFFDNGMVMVSDVNRGVFILKPKLAPDFVIENYHSGLFYNPEQDGHGLSVEILANNRIAIYWYTYDNDGRQMWLAGVGTFEDDVATLEVAITSGGFFPPNFLSSDVSTTLWGEFEFRVTSCHDIIFSWTPAPDVNFSAGSMTMTRLTEVNGLSCSQAVEQ